MRIWDYAALVSVGQCYDWTAPGDHFRHTRASDHGRFRIIHSNAWEWRVIDLDDEPGTSVRTGNFTTEHFADLINQNNLDPDEVQEHRYHYNVIRQYKKVLQKGKQVI